MLRGQGSLLKGSEVFMGCQGSNPNELHTKETPNPLYYLSGSGIFFKYALPGQVNAAQQQTSMYETLVQAPVVQGELYALHTYAHVSFAHYVNIWGAAI